jgi:hypothetical protein
MRAILAFPLIALLAASCASPAPIDEATEALLGGESRALRGGAVSPIVDPISPSLHAAPGVSVAEPPLDLEALQGPACEAPGGYTAVDLEVLLGDPQPWDGAIIVTRGPVSPQVICSAMVCPEVATCCRRCWTTHTMNGAAGSGNGAGDHVGLQVPLPECAKTCECAEPSGPIGDSLVWGTFRVQGDSVAIELDGFCDP